MLQFYMCFFSKPLWANGLFSSEYLCMTHDLIATLQEIQQQCCLYVGETLSMKQAILHSFFKVHFWNDGRMPTFAYGNSSNNLRPLNCLWAGLFWIIYSGLKLPLLNLLYCNLADIKGHVQTVYSPVCRLRLRLWPMDTRVCARIYFYLFIYLFHNTVSNWISDKRTNCYVYHQFKLHVGILNEK